MHDDEQQQCIRERDGDQSWRELWSRNPSFGGTQFDTRDDQIKVIGLQATTTVPEPTTYALMAAGLAGVFGVSRRRRRNA